MPVELGTEPRALHPRRPVPLRAKVHGTVGVEVRDCGGRPVVWAAMDPAHRKGALAESDGTNLTTAAMVALAERIPIVVVMASSGADVHEGVSALHGWGGAAHQLVRCSGIVPVIVVAQGPAVSGPALLLGIADHVIMTPDAYAFVSGPHMVRAFTGVPVGTTELGGAGAHAHRSGVASLVVADAEQAEVAVEELLAYLPANNDELPPVLEADDESSSPDDPGFELPAAATGSYDVRDAVQTMIDPDSLLELRSGWAGNLVTGLATVAGMPIGVVANQPMTLAGAIDITASQKGARFVAFCDAFNLPLLTVVDTSGFLPGKDLEWRGMIRHGAQLAFAYARASVPRISVTVRKSYGGAYIVMDSKEMGCDLALAWPTAEIAVMGSRGAVEILHRRIPPEDRAALEAAYDERYLNPYVAAERGLIDAVIEPAATRGVIADALAAIGTKREHLAHRTHDNTPL